MELPREDPEAALRLFAGVPGLRVLVVGGDGTIGCVKRPNLALPSAEITCCLLRHGSKTQSCTGRGCVKCSVLAVLLEQHQKSRLLQAGSAGLLTASLLREARVRCVLETQP